MIPCVWRDPVLRISPQWYTKLCIPVRICIGLFVFLTIQAPHSFQTGMLFCLQAFSLLILLFFSYKQWKNPHSWKNYSRVLMIYSLILCITVSSSSLSKIFLSCSLLIWIDLLLGQQSWYQSHLFGNYPLDSSTVSISSL